MRLVLDPAEDAAHGEWLRTQPGAYEWWYFDALSDDGRWALACIWFLGNPFSPYYRLAAQGKPADPFAHNALFFALYKDTQLHAYHFTRFPRNQVFADELRPATLRFGGSDLSHDDGGFRLRLADENANRRTLAAELTFAATPLVSCPSEKETAADSHFWLPAAPHCRVSGGIRLGELNSWETERISFTGAGYHDHNWGMLPFARNIREWYWARAALTERQTIVVYHLVYRDTAPVSHLLLFDGGTLLRHDSKAHVARRGTRVNGFGSAYAASLAATSGDVTAIFRLGRRLDSAPFYIRMLCEAEMTQGGITKKGQGIGEYFRPQSMAGPLVASAMKARIVEQ